MPLTSHGWLAPHEHVLLAGVAMRKMSCDGRSCSPLSYQLWVLYVMCLFLFVQLSPPSNGQVVAGVSWLITLALTPIQNGWAAIQLSPDEPLESFFFYLSLAILLVSFLSQPRQ